MAPSKSKQAETAPDNPAEAPAVSEATDGGDSRLTAGYSDNPDKPGPDSVAQVEELKDESSEE